MIELQTSVKNSKQDDTTRTRTPKPGYLKLTSFGYLSPYLHGGVYSQKKAGCGRATLASDWRVVSTSLNYRIIMLINMNRSLQFGIGLKLSVSAV
jgi:hypothetical protein